MKVLIVGSTGFIGRSVLKIVSREHDVCVANRTQNGEGSFAVDLTELGSIRKVMNEVRPDVVISCVGIIDAKDNFSLNVTFTRNLLEAIVEEKVNVKRVIISGSAGEYGLVDSLPVSEDTPLRATSEYGLSKVREEEVAKHYASEYGIPVTVARIFNPIGPGMKERFLVPNLLSQIDEYKSGGVDKISLGRLDSQRDYIAVDDIARAFNAIINGEPKHFAYNIGSGVSTTNEAILEMLVRNVTLPTVPPVVETFDAAEPMAAVQADINYMKTDFNWQPESSLEEVVKEIINEYEK